MIRRVTGFLTTVAVAALAAIPLTAGAQVNSIAPRPTPPPAASSVNPATLAALMAAMQDAQNAHAAQLKQPPPASALTAQQLAIQAALDQAAKTEAAGKADSKTAQLDAISSMIAAATSMNVLAQKQKLAQSNHAIIIGNVSKTEQTLQDEVEKSGKSPNAADKIAILKQMAQMNEILAAEKAGALDNQKAYSASTGKASDQLAQAKLQKLDAASLALLKANEDSMQATADNEAAMLKLIAAAMAQMTQLQQTLQSASMKASRP